MNTLLGTSIIEMTVINRLFVDYESPPILARGRPHWHRTVKILLIRTVKKTRLFTRLYGEVKDSEPQDARTGPTVSISMGGNRKRHSPLSFIPRDSNWQGNWQNLRYH